MRLRRLSLAAACGILTLVEVVAAVVIGWVASDRSGPNGTTAVAVAAVVCWVAGLVALVIIGLTRETTHAVAGLLFAMLARMTLPLAAGVTLSVQGGPLAEAGAVGYIVVLYLLTLAVETVLCISLARKPSASNEDLATNG